MTQEITVNIDSDSLMLDDLLTLETGEGMHALIMRTVTEVVIDGQPAANIGLLPMSTLTAIGSALGEAIKGLANPNA